MFPDWNAKEVVEIWEAGIGVRQRMQLIKSYHDGRQKIRELLEKRLDGKSKSSVLTNWVKYVGRMHTGFLTKHPVTYSMRDGKESQALSDYLAFYDSENLSALDGEHFRNALLYGYSVEVHWFSDGRPRVQSTWPWDWTFVTDEWLQVKTAIHRQFVPKFTMLDGEMVTKDTAVFRVYTDTEIRTYKTSAGMQVGTGNAMVEGSDVDEAGSAEFVSSDPHPYGRVPIVVFRVSEDGSPFLQEDFLNQCDTYDVTRSALQDDVRHNVDSMLKTVGLKSESLLDKDADGMPVYSKLKEMGIFPVPTGGDVEYLTNQVDVEKFRQTLKETRYSIHMMGCVPDLEGAIGGGDSGTITNISGIALKLLFHLMDQASSEMEKFFREGLRDRVELWNVMNRTLRGSELEDYQLTMTRNFPFNETELVQYLPNLAGVLSTEDKIKLLPFIDSPAQAVEKLRQERLESGILQGDLAGSNNSEGVLL
jgi:SPP1 family phage portal protein